MQIKLETIQDSFIPNDKPFKYLFSNFKARSSSKMILSKRFAQVVKKVYKSSISFIGKPQNLESLLW